MITPRDVASAVSGTATEAQPPAADLRRLLESVAAGDTAALDRVYDLVGDHLYGLALWRTGSTADAADAVQDVFLRLVRRRRRLGAIRDPLAYLRRAIHRICIDIGRRAGRRREESIETPSFLVDPGSDPERAAEARDLSRHLAGLPPRHREALYLRHMAGCTFAEIGRATGVPTFTAASRCRLALARLRKRLGVSI